MLGRISGVGVVIELRCFNCVCYEITVVMLRGIGEDLEGECRDLTVTTIL